MYGKKLIKISTITPLHIFTFFPAPLPHILFFRHPLIHIFSLCIFFLDKDPTPIHIFWHPKSYIRAIPPLFYWGLPPAHILFIFLCTAPRVSFFPQTSLPHLYFLFPFHPLRISNGITLIILWTENRKEWLNFSYNQKIAVVTYLGYNNYCPEQ